MKICERTHVPVTRILVHSEGHLCKVSSLNSCVISERGTLFTSSVSLSFWTRLSLVWIFFKGMWSGVKVQIFPFAVANGFSLSDCFVQAWSFFSPSKQFAMVFQQISKRNVEISWHFTKQLIWQISWPMATPFMRNNFGKNCLTLWSEATFLTAGFPWVFQFKSHLVPTHFFEICTNLCESLMGRFLLSSPFLKNVTGSFIDIFESIVVSCIHFSETETQNSDSQVSQFSQICDEWCQLHYVLICQTCECNTIQS